MIAIKKCVVKPCHYVLQFLFTMEVIYSAILLINEQRIRQRLLRIWRTTIKKKWRRNKITPTIRGTRSTHQMILFDVPFHIKFFVFYPRRMDRTIGQSMAHDGNVLHPRLQLLTASTELSTVCLKHIPSSVFPSTVLTGHLFPISLELSSQSQYTIIQTFSRS